MMHEDDDLPQPFNCTRCRQARLGASVLVSAEAWPEEDCDMADVLELLCLECWQGVRAALAKT